MSRDNNNLPSYRDFIENPEDLPSVEELKEENLPSVEDFVEKTVEEETQTIENSDGDSFLEVTDVVQVPEWSELVRLVNDVRKDIPEIPEIRYYDDQLAEISAQIEQIQSNYAKTDKIDVLSVQSEEFEGKLFEIESKIPTVKYYDHDINSIYDKITDIKEELKSLPEVKYYEEDLESLKSRIEQVNEDIPTFPDWIQEVQEVPDFSWIGKTFSLIDDDFCKVQGHIDIIKEKINREVNELNESLEVKEFEFKVDVKNLGDNLDQTNDRITETKDKIYQEIKETSIRITTNLCKSWIKVYYMLFCKFILYCICTGRRECKISFVYRASSKSSSWVLRFTCYSKSLFTYISIFTRVVIYTYSNFIGTNNRVTSCYKRRIIPFKL